MITRFSLRTFARLVAVGATISFMGCAASPTAPVSSRGIHAGDSANRDGDPPSEYCASGWTQVDGRWVCEDRGI